MTVIILVLILRKTAILFTATVLILFNIFNNFEKIRDLKMLYK